MVSHRLRLVRPPTAGITSIRVLTLLAASVTACSRDGSATPARKTRLSPHVLLDKSATGVRLYEVTGRFRSFHITWRYDCPASAVPVRMGIWLAENRRPHEFGGADANVNVTGDVPSTHPVGSGEARVAVAGFQDFTVFISAPGAELNPKKYRECPWHVGIVGLR